MPLRHLPTVLALSLLGCPPAREMMDAGEGDDVFSLDATDHHDTGHQDVFILDATDHQDVADRDAAVPQDAGVDAWRADTFVCACDDGNACSIDTCDASGACVHTSICGAGTFCEVSTSTCVREALCVRDADCYGAMCQPSFGCWHGRCRHGWVPDSDGDGELDRGCGGDDCAPNDPAIPGPEICGGIDEDCDTIADEGVTGLETNYEHCGVCRQSCGGMDACVAGTCICEPGRLRCGSSSTRSGIECAEVMTNPRNCGFCSNACAVGERCVGGRCVL